MDVQGLEVEVLKGACESLRRGTVAAFLIGTHGRGRGLRLHEQCREILQANGYAIEVDLPDTKMALLNTISIIVERLEHHVSAAVFNLVPCADNLDHPLREQHRLPTSAPLGAVWGRTPYEASYSHTSSSFDQRYEGRITQLPCIIPAHHSERY